MNRITPFAVLFIIHVFFSFGYTQNWWTGEEEGWFFYNEKIHQKPEIKETEPKEVSSPQELFTEKMEKLGKELISRAIEDPSEENIKAYMEYNKAMLALSDNFSKAWQKVLIKYPELLFDTNLKYAQTDIDKAIFELSSKAGLYFIYSFSCPACKKQAKVLKEFQQKYPMTVLPITMDKPLPEYPDTEFDNGITTYLNVTHTPSIYIAFPKDGKVDLISQGFVDRFELERRLFNYVQPIENKNIFDSISYIMPSK